MAAQGMGPARCTGFPAHNGSFAGEGVRVTPLTFLCWAVTNANFCMRRVTNARSVRMMMKERQ